MATKTTKPAEDGKPETTVIDDTAGVELDALKEAIDSLEERIAQLEKEAGSTPGGEDVTTRLKALEKSVGLTRHE